MTDQKTTITAEDVDEYEWKFNAWTGNYTSAVTENLRIIRMGREPPYMYLAEFWGDHSMEFPVHAGWCTTLTEALRRAEVRSWLHQPTKKGQCAK